MTSLLVTGATGCAGGGIMKYLEKNAPNTTIYALVRKEPKEKNERINYLYGNLADKNSLKNALKDVNVGKVWHIAGGVEQHQPKEYFYKINTEGTENLLSEVIDAGCKEFMFTSSVSIYGKLQTIPVNEEHETQPSGHYAKSKFLAEEKVREYCENYSIKGGIVRLPLVIGQGDRYFSNYISKFLKFNFLPIMGDSKHRVSVVHPYDIGQAFNLIGRNAKEKDVELYNVVSCNPTFKELIQVIEKRLIGKNRRKINFPYPILFFSSFLFEMGSKILNPRKETLFNRNYARMMGKEWVFSTKKIEKLGYSPKYDLEEIVEDTIQDHSCMI